jgi:cell filamentation protein
MTDTPHGSRYDVSGNLEAQFVDAAQQVLVNRPGITDLETLQIAEEAALASAYERLLREMKVDTPLTGELLRYIHGAIFGELFVWAGRWRTVNISKPGAVWPTAAFLDESMTTFEREVLLKHPLSGLHSDEDFIAAVAEIQGEFLSIHPFREGNARTIKLATDLLAVQTGRPLLRYDQTDAGANAYIAAASAALHQRDITPLKRLIRAALEQSRT